MLKAFWLNAFRRQLSSVRRSRSRVQSRSAAIERLENRALLAAQVVGPTAGTLSQDIVPGNAVSIDVVYSTTDDTGAAAQIQANALGVRLHYDSSVLTFNNVTNEFTTGQAAAIADQAEGTSAGDEDSGAGSASTDRYLLASWFDFNGAWPGVANTLPLDIFTANFTTNAGFTGSTTLNFTRAANPPNLADFTPTSAVINEFVVPNVSISDAAAVTEGGSSVFTVTLDQAPSGTVTVDYTTADGTATTADSDYTSQATQLTFLPGGALTQQITIATTDDNNVEPDEGFVVNLTAATNGTITTAQGAATILNDDVPTVSVTDAGDVAEGDAADFIVSLDQAPLAPVTVTVSTADGTAADPGDYTSTAAQQLIFNPGGALTQQVTITTIDDTLSEADETFTLDIDSVVGGTEDAVDGSGTATILANDDPVISISDAVTVAEGTSVVFTVSLDQTPARTLTIDYTTTDGTAVAGSDFTADSGTLTFNVGGALTQQITITTTDDTTVESTENFTVDLSAPVNGTLGTASGSGQLTSDDIPAITVSDSADVNEGGNAVFTVSLDQAPVAPVSVTVSTTDGTAEQPGDYTAVVNQVVTFNPGGALSQDIPVITIDDSDFEATEAFTLDATSPTGGTIAVSSGSATILNDDFPTISISDAATVTEGSDAVFTVSIDQSPIAGVDLTVDVTTTDGTTTSGSDYTAVTRTLTFTSAGPLTQTVAVTTTDDIQVEADESFTVDLGNAVNGVITDGQGDGTITSDDVPMVTVTAATAASEGANVIFTVLLDQAPLADVTVVIDTTDGTAVSPDDFTAVSAQTLTFTPTGSLSQQVIVATNDDNLVESDETFSADLSNPTGVTIVNGQATVTLTSDDVPSISISDATAVDEGTAASFIVSLDQAPLAGSDVTVDVTTVDGTAGAGTDFNSVSQTLTFTSTGTLTQEVTVATTDDTLVEASEAFTAQISNAANGTITDATGDGTINSADVPTVSFTVDEIADITEGTDAVFTVSLDQLPLAGMDVTVDVDSITGDPTLGTFAESDVDFTAIDQTLTFTSLGTLTQTVTVTTTDDATVEQTEEFSLQLSGPSNAVLGTTALSSVSLLDDDGPAISVDDPASVAEGSDVVFTVTLDQSPVTDVTVDVVTTDGTAVATDDYTAIATLTLTFTPGGALTQTVTVMTVDDSATESSETFTLDLSNPSGGTISDAQGEATLTDNDSTSDPAPTLAISPDGTTTADDPIVFTFQFSESVTGFDATDVTVTNGMARTFTAVDGDTYTLTVNPTASGAVIVDVAADAVVDSANNGNASATATVTSNINPAAATPVLDVLPEVVSTTMPTATWQAVSGISTYEVWFTRRFPAESRILQANSMVTTASFTPPSDLDAGFYKVWVRTVDGTGAAGPWSDDIGFEIRPTLLNTDVRTFESRPTFAWNAVPNAPGYEIFIRTITGDIRVTDIASTSYTPTVDLASGPVRWWIRTSDAIGNKGWSDVGLVDVRTTVLSAANNSITWQAVSGAGRYILHVQNIDTNAVVVREDQLTGTSFTPTTPISGGNYRIWVKAINASNNLFTSGLWSQSFDLSIPVVSNDAGNENTLVALPDAANEISLAVASDSGVDAAHTAPETQSVFSESQNIAFEASKPAVRPNPEDVSAVETEMAFLDALMGESLDLGSLLEA